jgi:hypothetical protein
MKFISGHVDGAWHGVHIIHGIRIRTKSVIGTVFARVAAGVDRVIHDVLTKSYGYNNV